jgi:hypothetical protein
MPMQTLMVIAGGLILLGICLLIGRYTMGPTQAQGFGRAARIFLPVWLVASALNLWIGVSRQGYTLAEELPVFGLVFMIPAAFAVFVWWKVSRA